MLCAGCLRGKIQKTKNMGGSPSLCLCSRGSKEPCPVFTQLAPRPVDNVRVVMLRRSDRASGTSDERHQSEARFRFVFGLMIDAALFAVIVEDCGRKLATRVAIDAGCVDKEIARQVFRQALADVGHCRVDDRQRSATVQAGGTILECADLSALSVGATCRVHLRWLMTRRQAAANQSGDGSPHSKVLASLSLSD